MASSSSTSDTGSSRYPPTLTPDLPRGRFSDKLVKEFVCSRAAKTLNLSKSNRYLNPWFNPDSNSVYFSVSIELIFLFEKYYCSGDKEREDYDYFKSDKR